MKRTITAVCVLMAAAMAQAQGNTLEQTLETMRAYEYRTGNAKACRVLSCTVRKDSSLIYLKGSSLVIETDGIRLVRKGSVVETKAEDGSVWMYVDGAKTCRVRRFTTEKMLAEEKI